MILKSSTCFDPATVTQVAPAVPQDPRHTTDRQPSDSQPPASEDQKQVSDKHDTTASETEDSSEFTQNTYGHSPFLSKFSKIVREGTKGTHSIMTEFSEVGWTAAGGVKLTDATNFVAWQKNIYNGLLNLNLDEVTLPNLDLQSTTLLSGYIMQSVSPSIAASVGDTKTVYDLLNMIEWVTLGDPEKAKGRFYYRLQQFSFAAGEKLRDVIQRHDDLMSTAQALGIQLDDQHKAASLGVAVVKRYPRLQNDIVGLSYERLRFRLLDEAQRLLNKESDPSHCAHCNIDGHHISNCNRLRNAKRRAANNSTQSKNQSSAPSSSSRRAPASKNSKSLSQTTSMHSRLLSPPQQSHQPKTSPTISSNHC